jgi:phosphatidylinositol glycan class F
LFGERPKLPGVAEASISKQQMFKQQQHLPEFFRTHTTMAATETKTKAIKSHPIESWDDGLSPIYTHLHPLLLLGLFYYQFPSLVEKPIDTLPQLAMGVAALQLLYLCICIPGSNQSQLPTRGKKKGKMAQNHGGDTGFGAKLVVSRRIALTLGDLLY